MYAYSQTGLTNLPLRYHVTLYLLQRISSIVLFERTYVSIFEDCTGSRSNALVRHRQLMCKAYIQKLRLLLVNCTIAHRKLVSIDHQWKNQMLSNWSPEESLHLKIIEVLHNLLQPMERKEISISWSAGSIFQLWIDAGWRVPSPFCLLACLLYRLLPWNWLRRHPVNSECISSR